MMSPAETVRTALDSIRANLLRSMLTMLGIIIGVAAVITMVAVGSGAQQMIDDQLSALGSQLVSVTPGQSFQRGVASMNRVSLTVDDANALSAHGYPIQAVVPELQAGRQIKYGNRNAWVGLVGTTPSYASVNNLNPAFGRMFSESDNAARRRVAVVGWGIAASLGEEPMYLVGTSIYLGQIPFEVVGVFAERGWSFGAWGNPDDEVYVPIETARYRALGMDRIRSVSVQIAEGVSLEQGMVEIERVLRREHKIGPGGENDFMIMDRRQVLDVRQQAAEVFTYLLASIAGVSLLVGGIGIMNIMLVSVTERTREIGIRKALGATRNNIMAQFLIEALTIGAFGGVLGIAFGAVGAHSLANVAGWPAFVSPEAVGLAVAFSVGIGLFFGLWPARRAALLDPIDALRHD
jgi:putative ABC transport system permease protein